MDADGDLDCLIGESYGNVNYFENTGNASFPLWSLAATDYFSYDTGFSASPFCADFDNDGDFDCVGSISS